VEAFPYFLLALKDPFESVLRYSIATDLRKRNRSGIKGDCKTSGAKKRQQVLYFVIQQLGSRLEVLNREVGTSINKQGKRDTSILDIWVRGFGFLRKTLL